jgi:hypothetical protein
LASAEETGMMMDLLQPLPGLLFISILLLQDYARLIMFEEHSLNIGNFLKRACTFKNKNALIISRRYADRMTGQHSTPY